MSPLCPPFEYVVLPVVIAITDSVGKIENVVRGTSEAPLELEIGAEDLELPPRAVVPVAEPVDNLVDAAEVELGKDEKLCAFDGRFRGGGTGEFDLNGIAQPLPEAPITTGMTVPRVLVLIVVGAVRDPNPE